MTFLRKLAISNRLARRWIEPSLCFLRLMRQLLGIGRLFFCWHEIDRSMQIFDPALNQPFNCKKKLHIKSTCTVLDRIIVVLLKADAPALGVVRLPFCGQAFVRSMQTFSPAASELGKVSSFYYIKRD